MTMPDGLTAEIVNYEDFSRMIQDYKNVFGSARVPFAAVLDYWQKWNFENIYRGGDTSDTAEGMTAGRYEDLSESYKDFKEDLVGFIYPVLRLHGVLMESITGSSSRFAIIEISDDELLMGTNAESLEGAPYALYLQKGTRKMPARPPIIKTPDQLDALARIFFETAKRQFSNIQKS